MFAVRHIEAETGIRSIVISKQVIDGTQEVILTGEKDAVEMAEKLCSEILTSKCELTKGTQPQAKESQALIHKQDDKEMETVCIPVPQLVVQDLIGKKGVNLLGITRASRTRRISILDPIESGLRQARVIGRPQAVKKAIKLIEDFCNDKIPGYKTMYNITEREGDGNGQINNKTQRDSPLAGSEKLPCKNEASTSISATPSPSPPQKTDSDAADPLLVFLTSQSMCLKCSPKDFYAWLQREDVVSFEELALAVQDADFVVQMQANGLKVNLSIHFVLYSHDVFDRASSALRS